MLLAPSPTHSHARLDTELMDYIDGFTDMLTTMRTMLPGRRNLMAAVEEGAEEGAEDDIEEEGRAKEQKGGGRAGELAAGAAEKVRFYFRVAVLERLFV